MDDKRKDITAVIGKDELSFKVGLGDYERYVNEVSTDNKVAPSKRFLKRTLADSGQEKLLEKHIESGLALEITAEVIKEFKPNVEISIKK